MTDPRPHPIGPIDHVAVVVRSIEESLPAYQRLFGYVASGPLIDLPAFRSHPFVMVTLSGFLSNFLWALSVFVATVWLQDVKDLSPLESGLAFLAMSAGVAFAGAAGRVRDPRLLGRGGRHVRRHVRRARSNRCEASRARRQRDAVGEFARCRRSPAPGADRR